MIVFVLKSSVQKIKIKSHQKWNKIHNNLKQTFIPLTEPCQCLSIKYLLISPNKQQETKKLI